MCIIILRVVVAEMLSVASSSHACRERFGGDCDYKENGPYAHLLWILVFDDQHNQIGLMNLQVIIL